MSENILRLIPGDPLYVPSSVAQQQAHALLVSLLPMASEVQITVTEEVSFIDPGSNLERIVCPSCGALLPMDWWGQMMDHAFTATRFRDLSIIMPCCEMASSLNNLHYEWSAGFARFLLEAYSPENDLTEEQVSLFEHILGCSVRKIWAHY